MFNHILFNLIQVLVVMAFAPLASGVLSRLKEIVQSKRGPSVFQPYRDLWKLFHKDEIVSEDSSWIFRFTPYIVFVTPIFVALLTDDLATKLSGEEDGALACTAGNVAYRRPAPRLSLPPSRAVSRRPPGWNESPSSARAKSL